MYSTQLKRLDAAICRLKEGTTKYDDHLHFTANSFAAPSLEFPKLSSNLIEWVIKAQRFFVYFGLNDEQRFSVVPYYVDGRVLDWFDFEKPLRSWSSFLKTLVYWFGPSVWDEDQGIQFVDALCSCSGRSLQVQESGQNAPAPQGQEPAFSICANPVITSFHCEEEVQSVHYNFVSVLEGVNGEKNGVSDEKLELNEVEEGNAISYLPSVCENASMVVLEMQVEVSLVQAQEDVTDTCIGIKMATPPYVEVFSRTFSPIFECSPCVRINVEVPKYEVINFEVVDVGAILDGGQLLLNGRPPPTPPWIKVPASLCEEHEL